MSNTNQNQVVPAPKPGDWMENSQTLANIGHFLGGYAIPLTTAFFSYIFLARAWWLLLLIQGLLAAYVLIKEFWYDLKYETGETVWTSAEDAFGYFVGSFLAWGFIGIVYWTGHW